jgi:hypothetical protein
LKRIDGINKHAITIKAQKEIHIFILKIPPSPLQKLSTTMLVVLLICGVPGYFKCGKYR